MKPHKFKLGDRVILDASKNNHEFPYEFPKGTVVRIAPDDNFVSIEFDEFIEGHECNGYAKHGHGWNCLREDLQLITHKQEKPIIVNGEAYI